MPNIVHLDCIFGTRLGNIQMAASGRVRRIGLRNIPLQRRCTAAIEAMEKATGRAAVTRGADRACVMYAWISSTSIISFVVGVLGMGEMHLGREQYITSDRSGAWYIFYMD
jgi:hypothetical protein